MRTSVVILNKIDLPQTSERRDQIKKYCDKEGIKLIAVSAATGEGIESLKFTLAKKVKANIVEDKNVEDEY